MVARSARGQPGAATYPRYGELPAQRCHLSASIVTLRSQQCQPGAPLRAASSIVLQLKEVKKDAKPLVAFAMLTPPNCVKAVLPTFSPRKS